MIFLDHRGIGNDDGFSESSYEAFKSSIEKGFGLEFDLNIAKDGFIVSHKSTLEKITDGKDNRKISDISIQELNKIRSDKYKNSRISTLNELLDLIRITNSMHAFHIKGQYQINEILVKLIQVLNNYFDILSQIIIFDLKPQTAVFFRKYLPNAILAPSVAHDYDIERYNLAVNNTLISLNEAVKYKKEGIYDWVWLDEWDKRDKENKEKTFYTKNIFNRLRKHGYKIALVTPELHATSPDLHGGEFHEDAINKEVLFKRIKEILLLNPDAICTDYPQEIKNL